MVTRLFQGRRPRLYPREHRKAKGLSAQTVAHRMGIERESLLRLEREAQRRMTPEKQQQYADALGIPVEQLWRPPGTPSLDETTAEISPELREIITDFVQSVVARRRR